MISNKLLLYCGIASSALYVAMNVFVPFGFAGYDSASMTVSELSAIDAPTRTIWVWFGFIYTVLFGAFSMGVWKTSGTNRAIKITACLLVVYTLANLFWPMFPMHQREALAAGEKSYSDTMHLVLAGFSVMVMVAAMGFSAFAFTFPFRTYAVASIIIQLFFGILTSIEAPGVEANSPTPLIGVWERINIGVFLLWVAILSIVLLKKGSTQQEITVTQGSISRSDG